MCTTYITQACLHTLMQTGLSANQSAYYPSYFISIIWHYHMRDLGEMPPTNVARVRFPDPASYVGWVCWFCALHREVFAGCSGFPPPQGPAFDLICAPCCPIIVKEILDEKIQRNTKILPLINWHLFNNFFIHNKIVYLIIKMFISEYK